MGDAPKFVRFTVQVRAAGGPDSYSVEEEEGRVVVRRDSSDLEDVREIGPGDYPAVALSLGYPSATPIIDAVRAAVADGREQELVRVIQQFGRVTYWRRESEWDF